MFRSFKTFLLYRLLESFYIPISIISNYQKAGIKEYSAHHDEEYLQVLLNDEFILHSETPNEEIKELLEEFGLIDDCFLFPGIKEYLSNMTGATLFAAHLISTNQTRVAVHWEGGRHHARRDQAQGFCHINDIVLAILNLKSSFQRILYVDLDIHHGDGVEEAFAYTPSITTISFHMYEPGFFPGTGSLADIGFGRGKYHTINVPLKRGLGDLLFLDLFTSIVPPLIQKLKPQVIFLQAGCDGLAKDPLGGWALSTDSLAWICEWMVGIGVPLLVVGGGGYVSENAAKCWTLCTMAMNRKIQEMNGEKEKQYGSIPESPLEGESIMIPEECPDWTLYAPDYSLAIPKTNMRDENDAEYLKMVKETILNNIELIPSN